MNDVRIARITGTCGLACVAPSVGQFPLWLGNYPSFYDGPEFARYLFGIKNIAFTRILMDQGVVGCVGDVRQRCAAALDRLDRRHCHGLMRRLGACDVRRSRQPRRFL
ncbi:MAG TPA: hypothetical protein VF491_18105 [Vicinamibacterales bacterium]|jgi:hypothetical protein